MRFLACAIVGLTLLTASSRAQLGPDWLPSTPASRPAWDLRSNPMPSRAGEELTDLLNLRRQRNAVQPITVDALGRLRVFQPSNNDFDFLKGRIQMPDLKSPWLGRDWRAEESLSVPLPLNDSIFVFGKLESEGDAYDSRATRFTGKTGVGWKGSLFSGGELQFRTGPIVNYSDLYSPVGVQQQSLMSVELQAKVSLLGPLLLQYSGEALPSLTPGMRHSVMQDVKLALPFGVDRELHVGARYRWEDALATPWIDRTHLYLGIRFQH